MISAKSVKDRLKNQAVIKDKSFQETLIAYGLERTLYRLSISKYMERFTIKGGILLYALFEGEFARTTRDIDLLARNIPNNSDDMRKVFVDILSIVSDDALKYDLESLEVKNITEFKEYHGVNVNVMAYLDRTRVPVSIDIGFGDVVYPERVKMDFPVILDMQAPEIYAYSIVSVIAEKFEAIVSLGDANSRYKDFYDIYIIATRYKISGSELKEAIKATFEHRGTEFDDIFAFTEDFLSSEIHQNRWNAFQKKKNAMVKTELGEVVILLKELLLPIVESIHGGTDYSQEWNYLSKRWE